MDAITLLLDLTRRPLEAADHLRPKIAVSNLNVHVGGHDNSIAWLLWHTGREIDAQVAHLSGDDQIWRSRGFADRFALDVADDEIGYGQDPGEARSVVVEDVALLFEYLTASVETQVAYVESLSPQQLDDVVDEAWDPPVTRGARLVSCTEDALMHLGQAAYVAGASSSDS